MRILFVQALTYPFIGVMSLSAVLRRGGHETRLQILNMNRPSGRDFAKIREFEPQIVALPVYTGWQRSALKFCSQLKERMDSTVVLGGPHPTHCPEIVQHEAVDFVCVGEGERSFVELANRLERGERIDDIPGIWLKNGNGIIDNGASVLPDLEDLPPMDVDLYCKVSRSIRLQENREFSLNRGCPFQCTYCGGPALKALYGSHFLRSKTVDQAIEEIQYVYERYPFKSVMFVSDNLFVKKDFAMEFLERYTREIRLPFYCQMRIELVDGEVARALRTAGCHVVAVGIESGSTRVRKEILGRVMSNEKIIQACRTFQREGIKVNTYNMVGIPGESFDEALETVRLNAEIQPSTAWCSFFQPYPRTGLTEKLLSEGRITRDIFERVPGSFFEKSPILDGDENAHLFRNLQRLFNLWVAHPRLGGLFRRLCNVNAPRVYDLLFLWSFYTYVRKSYKKSRTEAFSRIVTNALQAWKA